MAESEIILSINNLSKEFVNRTGLKINLFENLSLNLIKGQFISILSPQGCGKSTFLRILAGIEMPSMGEIKTGNKNKTQFKIALIPTKPSSFPWLNVENNIKYILDIISKDYSNKKIKNLIEIVGLAGYENHYPNNKSVGFRFRISLARAFAVEPQLILLDEPFNDLDLNTKKEIYLLLRNIQIANNVTFLLATSNISEAVYLSDSVIIMQENPAKILTEYEIKLPKDSNIETLIEKERNEIIKIYRTNSESSLHSLTI